MTQKRKNRVPALVGLLAAGAAVGAAGAVVVRRRRSAPEWEEYEPLPPADETMLGGESIAAEGPPDRVASSPDSAPVGSAPGSAPGSGIGSGFAGERAAERMADDETTRSAG